MIKLLPAINDTGDAGDGWMEVYRQWAREDGPCTCYQNRVAAPKVIFPPNTSPRQATRSFHLPLHLGLAAHHTPCNTPV